MIQNRKLTIIIGALMLIATSIVLIMITSSNLTPDQSAALYGGRLEFGYPSAGFLIVEDLNGGIKSCGYAAINESTGITASHCVDDARNIFAGSGNFRITTDRLLKALKAVQKPGWVNSKIRSEDFAILEFGPNDSQISFAEIATPVEGCHFRVVAYGRTENESEAIDRPRKSALLCGSEITSDTFTVTGADSGICFGDSGSPVYFEDTKQLVGVIASVIKDENSDVCSFNNTAIVVRADANLGILNNSLALTGGDSPVSAQEGIVIEVAEPGLAERLGLSEVANFASNNRIFLLVALGTVIAIVIMIAVISKREEKKGRQQHILGIR